MRLARFKAQHFIMRRLQSAVGVLDHTKARLWLNECHIVGCYEKGSVVGQHVSDGTLCKVCAKHNVVVRKK